MIDPFEAVIAVATALATLASIVALVFSVIAYRQRIKFHEQPMLTIEWQQRIEPTSGGLFFRRGSLWNHGDAAARDVRMVVDSGTTSDGAPWSEKKELMPGKPMLFRVPVVDRVVRTPHAGMVSFDRSGDPSDYAFVTPTVTVQWRQAPFGAKPRIAKFTAPHTPNLKAGETS